MGSFLQLSQAIVTAIGNIGAAAGVGIVQEDAEDLETQVSKAYNEMGMMVLLGVPGFKNKDARLSDVVNGEITIQILIREVPAIWRSAGNSTVPQPPIHCSDLARVIAPALQGLGVAGFEPLRVIDGYSGGNFKSINSSNSISTFQDYLLEIETMQVMTPT